MGYDPNGGTYYEGVYFVEAKLDDGWFYMFSHRSKARVERYFKAQR